MTMKSMKYNDCDTIMDGYSQAPPPLPRRVPPARNIYAEPFAAESTTNRLQSAQQQQQQQQHQSQQQSHPQLTQSMTNTHISTGSRLGGSSSLVMPVFPLRTAGTVHAPHYSPYSPSRFRIDKSCQHRCSWKCFSIALILVTIVLSGMLTYFAATSSMKSNLDSTNCILVQDVKSGVAGPDQTGTSIDSSNYGLLSGPSTLNPTEESPLTSTLDHNSFSTYGGVGGMGAGGAPNGALSAFNRNRQDPAHHQADLSQQQQQQQHQQQQQQQQHQTTQMFTTVVQQKWPSIIELRGFNEIHSSTIAPFQFWNVEFRNKHPAFVQFNFTLPWGANFAIYGRRNVGPTVTQYDFVEFIRGGRVDHKLRRKRSPPSTDPILDPHGVLLDHGGALMEHEENASIFEMVRRNRFAFDDLPLDEVERHIISKRSTDSSGGGNVGGAAAAAPASLRKIDMEAMTVNVTILQYLDIGRWYLSVYNDEVLPHTVSLVVGEAEGVHTACPSDCSGRGSCYLGKCDCIDGYQGNDCSISVCPVLCSAHGHYGGGVCHCEDGWKGSECDIPVSECEMPTCSNHGRCIEGDCHCERGWKGLFCEQQDCIDPSCSGHGTCVSGQCFCKAGWQGDDCSIVDQQVYQCLPGCSDHGTYDLDTGSCICDRHWTGLDCSQAVCSLDCGPNGICENGRCRCDDGWTGSLCDQLMCDPRCAEHGQCKNGTCVCSQGWNGRHCTLPGCVNGCSRHGQCTMEDGEYQCICIEGWAGSDCSMALEMSCKDNIDNDNDGMTDCSDSECCVHSSCAEHIMCLASNDPVEVLLRKQPPSVTASFYQRVKFLIEENSVQSYAHMDEYSESRVSVMRGQVVTPQGLGIIGIRVSVDRDSRFGFTLTRQGGWFDVLVNGGGAVTLQFQRSPFRPLTRTVFVPWNQIVVLPPVQMQINDNDDHDDIAFIRSVPSNPAYSFLSTSQYRFMEDSPSPVAAAVCLEHDHELLSPQLTSTWMPNGIGSVPGRNFIFAETQVVQESLKIPGTEINLLYKSSQASGYRSIVRMQLTHDRIPDTLTHVHVGVQIEGSLHVKTYEADPNLRHIFAWNKRNVYKQKVYGIAVARISIGYEHATCRSIVWETRTVKLQGFDVDISDIGGWGLDIHHHYNFHEGILQKGDGATIHLREFPRIVRGVLGDGQQRTLMCRDHCNGLSKSGQLLTPVALASGPDGSLYVGDFNLIRRVTTNGSVFTILQLDTTRVSYQYYLSVSPADGQLYISDSEKHKILKIVSLENVDDPSSNYDVIVGSGQRCIPGDEQNCGDGGPAIEARLSHPKGLAIAADRTMYIADGTNIRAVDPKGTIHTLIGHHGHQNRWSPVPCRGAARAMQVQLQWPTALALNPLDGSLYFVDDRLVLKLTADMKVKVIAGIPLHCNEDHGGGAGGSNRTAPVEEPLGTVLAMAFGPNGDLYVADTNSKRINTIKVIESSTGFMKPFAGKIDPSSQECECQGRTMSYRRKMANGTNSGGGGIASNQSLSGGALERAGTGSIGGDSPLCVCPGNLNATGSRKEYGDGGGGGFGAGGGAGAGSGTAPGADTVLSSSIRFQSISAIAVAQDGVINVADQGSLRIYALEHYLPQHDGNGEFQIPYTPLNELYVFNRYGQHVATRDLSTGKSRYSFLYSKNTSFGKLSTVTDSSGNKIQFLRDYSNVVSSIETGQDYKTELKISASGLLTKVAARSGGGQGRKVEVLLDYESNSGLLISRTEGQESFIYQFDDFGRCTKVIAPSGEIVHVRTVFEERPVRPKQEDLLVSVQGSIRSAFGARGPSKPTEYAITGSIQSVAVTRGDKVTVGRIGTINQTVSLALPAGIRLEAAAIVTHPWLERFLPTEAEMLPMWSYQALQLGERPLNDLRSNYELSAAGCTATTGVAATAGAGAKGERMLCRDIYVNDAKKLRLEYDPVGQRETLRDRDNEIILSVAYDQSGLPTGFYPGSDGEYDPLNITYDRFNRVEGWQWGPAELRYNYDRQGRLAEVTSAQDGIVSYGYNEGNLLELISLGSQRKFRLTYDRNGGLREIVLPSGTRHSFSLQPSIGFLRFTYNPPGSSRSYLQHYAHSGALLQTVFPGDGARIVYRYDDEDRIAEIVHGDGRDEFLYQAGGAGGGSAASTCDLPMAIIHTERDLEFRWDFDCVGGLLVEERIDFSARSGLSNVKFNYEYDDHFRLAAIGGRIGGQNLPQQAYGYDERTGRLATIGQFEVMGTRGGSGGSGDRHQTNATTVSDRTGTFMRTVNGRFLLMQLTLTIHRMEVFRMEFGHDLHGRIVQTRTYTRNVGVNTYTNVKNFTWDCDGQLVGVEAQEPWGFRYDDNGNMLSLTYRGNTIPMEYNALDRIVKFGEGQYKYEPRGLVAQNAREERFHYNAKGLLIRATKRGRFDIRYFYDHLNRLITRKDNFGNVTQFFYTNQRRRSEISHIYSPRDGKLMSLTYDDRGALIYAQVYRYRYYIATDQCGTPVMIFNQYGEGIREIMRSPYGHIVYDSNPYLYMPIDFCGGILDQVTSLVHMPDGKVYDPLIGQWMTPNWEHVDQRISKPTKLHLYRYNGNDPINPVHQLQEQPRGHFEWLRLMGYDIENMIPQATIDERFQRQHDRLENALAAPNVLRRPDGHDRASVISIGSGFMAHLLERSVRSLRGLLQLPDFAASLKSDPLAIGPFRFGSGSDPPFGHGIIVSRSAEPEGYAIVSSVPAANPIYRDVYTSVFNRTRLLPFTFVVHNSLQDAFFFVKEDSWRASEDRQQLKRLQGQVNTTFHDSVSSGAGGPPGGPGSASGGAGGGSVSGSSAGGGSGVLGSKGSTHHQDVKIHTTNAIINLKYGTTAEKERQRLMHHAKLQAVRKAWHREKDLLRSGLISSYEWNAQEMEEIVKNGYANLYEGEYVHDIDRYPELLEDPFNVRFTKKKLNQSRKRKRRETEAETPTAGATAIANAF
ncbi:teneurin-a isoform X2 [Anopheles aquasalis]|uniref:teneurin-a isoform X2 n=1 Tax=Anopheles aquasalis TaxID=42839 RepID=UPI00215A4940|nr:teneurin-a isoform X2 [Anopheles aquasalis]